MKKWFGSKGRGWGGAQPGATRKRKRDEPAYQLTLRIDAAVREDDASDAFSALDEAEEHGLILPVKAYNSLLQLCAGGAGNARSEVLPQKAKEVEHIMAKRNVRKNEMTVTALARVAAASGEPKRALALVTLDRPPNLPLKFRSFSPALHAFCTVGDTSNALFVEQLALEEGTPLNEAEYSALCRCVAAHGTKVQAVALLQRLSNDLRMIGEQLLLDVRRLFEKSLEPLSAVHVDQDEYARTATLSEGKTLEHALSSHGVVGCNGDVGQKEQDIAVPALGHGWQCMMCNVDEQTGKCDVSEEVTLRAIDLSDEEFQRLREGIEKLAKERERENDFSSFLTWVNKHQPDVYIDGANVGMFMKNPKKKASFDFSQIDRILNTARSETKQADPPRKQPPVVVLHNIRTQKPPADMSKNQLTIRQWRNQHSLFTSPHGSNDDWYWLYGAVAAGEKGLLITNDELRDHIFQMLPEPRLFFRWKERHQVRFNITKQAVQLYMPVPFTTCIQHDTATSTGEHWWVFPSAEYDHWLLARRDSESRPTEAQMEEFDSELAAYKQEREAAIVRHREQMQKLKQEREQRESEQKQEKEKQVNEAQPLHNNDELGVQADATAEAEEEHRNVKQSRLDDEEDQKEEKQEEAVDDDDNTR